jgi:hypothetical protein
MNQVSHSSENFRFGGQILGAVLAIQSLALAYVGFRILSDAPRFDFQVGYAGAVYIFGALLSIGLALVIRHVVEHLIAIKHNSERIVDLLQVILDNRGKPCSDADSRPD